MHEIRDGGGVVFNLPFSEWVHLFTDSGLVIRNLHESRPPDGVTETTYRDATHIDWARRWPSELLWVLDRV